MTSFRAWAAQHLSGHTIAWLLGLIIANYVTLLVIGTIGWHANADNSHANCEAGKTAIISFDGLLARAEKAVQQTPTSAQFTEAEKAQALHFYTSERKRLEPLIDRTCPAVPGWMPPWN